jgi:hypothetical protein
MKLRLQLLIESRLGQTGGYEQLFCLQHGLCLSVPEPAMSFQSFGPLVSALTLTGSRMSHTWNTQPPVCPGLGLG